MPGRQVGEGAHVSGSTRRVDDIAPVLNGELSLQCHALALTDSQGVLPAMLLAPCCLRPAASPPRVPRPEVFVRGPEGGKPVGRA
jgi:hypothetical protein